MANHVSHCIYHIEFWVGLHLLGYVEVFYHPRDHIPTVIKAYNIKLWEDYLPALTDKETHWYLPGVLPEGIIVYL